MVVQNNLKQLALVELKKKQLMYFNSKLHNI